MIVYTVICRSKDAAVLVEVSSAALTGNAPQVTTALMEHLRDNPAAMKEGDLKTFVQRNEEEADFFSHIMMAACTIGITSTEELDLADVQEHYFHLVHMDGVFYCCLSDDADMKDQKVNFAFLQTIAKEFSQAYTKRRIKNSNAYAMDKDFGGNVRKTMHYYNINHKRLSQEKEIGALLAQVEDLKTVMGRNLQLLLEREEHLDRLVEKSEQTRRESLVFKKRAKQAKHILMWRNYKLTVYLTSFMLAIIYILFLVPSCGFRLKRCGEERG